MHSYLVCMHAKVYDKRRARIRKSLLLVCSTVGVSIHGSFCSRVQIRNFQFLFLTVECAGEGRAVALSILDASSMFGAKISAMSNRDCTDISCLLQTPV
jgi:hypothetical protein